MKRIFCAGVSGGSETSLRTVIVPLVGAGFT